MVGAHEEKARDPKSECTGKRCNRPASDDDRFIEAHSRSKRSANKRKNTKREWLDIKIENKEDDFYIINYKHYI